MSISKASGFTLIEVLISITIGSLLLISLMQLVDPAMRAHEQSRTDNDALQDGHFAMEQIRRIVSTSETLFIPMPDNPGTTQNESVRDVIAVAMPHAMDRDEDGWADGNNDRDFQDSNQNSARDVDEPERIDEDFGDDRFNSSGSGIYGIDDNNDGSIDEGGNKDDDEDGSNNEDPENGIDDDGDGQIDEDTKKDQNEDGESGVAGVDDDEDGSVDEENKNDNDEDGVRGEDWFDVIVFSVSGGNLVQRIPNLDPTDGTDFSTYVIAENVNSFSITRQVGGDGKTIVLDVTLVLDKANGQTKSFNSVIRLGGAL